MLEAHARPSPSRLRTIHQPIATTIARQVRSARPRRRSHSGGGAQISARASSNSAKRTRAQPSTHPQEQSHRSLHSITLAHVHACMQAPSRQYVTARTCAHPEVHKLHACPSAQTRGSLRATGHARAPRPNSLRTAKRCIPHVR
eukprot:6171965-Pleurochrysis_carterae.AAC.1